jgi:hypothetical protein
MTLIGQRYLRQGYCPGFVAGAGGLASGARVLQSPKVDVQSMNRQKSRDSWHWASHMAFDCKVE